jgi:hypothetical protein
MQSKGSVDFGRLLGFAAIGERLAGGVDFQDETFGARLGAKVGQEVCLALDLRDSGLAELAAEVDTRVAAVGKKVET